MMSWSYGSPLAAVSYVYIHHLPFARLDIAVLTALTRLFRVYRFLLL